MLQDKNSVFAGLSLIEEDLCVWLDDIKKKKNWVRKM